MPDEHVTSHGNSAAAADELTHVATDRLQTVTHSIKLLYISVAVSLVVTGFGVYFQKCSYSDFLKVAVASVIAIIMGYFNRSTHERHMITLDRKLSYISLNYNPKTSYHYYDKGILSILVPCRTEAVRHNPFVIGIATVFSFGLLQQQPTQVPAETDYDALAEDLDMISSDLFRAVVNTQIQVRTRQLGADTE